MESYKRRTITFVDSIETFELLLETNKKSKRKVNNSKERKNNKDYIKPFNAYAVFCREIRKEYALKNKEISLRDLGLKWEKLTIEQIDQYIAKYKEEVELYYKRKQHQVSKSVKKENIKSNVQVNNKKRSLSFSSEKKKVKYHKMLYSYNPELTDLIIKSCQKIKTNTEMKQKFNNKRKTGCRSKKKKCFCGKCKHCLND